MELPILLASLHRCREHRRLLGPRAEFHLVQHLHVEAHLLVVNAPETETDSMKETGLYRNLGELEL